MLASAQERDYEGSDEPNPRLNRAVSLFADYHGRDFSPIVPVSACWRLFEFYGGDYFIEASLLFAAIAVPIFLYSNMYQGIWRYASVEDLVTITKAVTLSILIFVPVLFLLTRWASTKVPTHPMVRVDGITWWAAVSLSNF